MTEKHCPATIELDDGRTLTCSLPVGHPGPVHQAADGEAWGDSALPKVLG